MPTAPAFRCSLALILIAGLESVSFGETAAQAAAAARFRPADAGGVSERMLVLAPGGPIVLQSIVFIDGVSQEQLREKQVDEILKLANPDGDGTPTWKEALMNPRLTYLVRLPTGGNAQQQEQVRASLQRQYDTNGDGTPDRPEVRAMLARNSGRVVSSPGFDGRGVAKVDLKPLLDADGDGGLSIEEIAAAPQRLKSRDANDNDLLEPAEVNPAATPGTVIRNPEQLYPSLLPLGLGANFQTIRAALLSRYGTDGRITAAGMPLFPRLLDSLDRNANGELDADEEAGFNSMRPHIAITVCFKSASFVPPEHDASGVTVNFLAPEFESHDVVNRLQETVALRLPGVRLTIAAPATVAQQQTNSRRNAEAQLMRYDTDKNGYLEKKELEGQNNAEFFMQQFDRWDENNDGKVYAAEIEAELERQMAAQRAQVSLMAQDLGTGLFAALDQSADSRLGLREMKSAAERLKTLDADGDGRIAGQELPTEIQVQLAQGGRGGFATSLNISQARTSPQSAGPKWFTHMDRNTDGDVTLREFLGKPDKFRELDTNGDGFIDPTEAALAK